MSLFAIEDSFGLLTIQLHKISGSDLDQVLWRVRELCADVELEKIDEFIENTGENGWNTDSESGIRAVCPGVAAFTSSRAEMLFSFRRRSAWKKKRIFQRNKLKLALKFWKNHENFDFSTSFQIFRLF